MAFYLFWPTASTLSEQGFGALAHVPCIFNEQWQYESVPSQYLCARGAPKFKSQKDLPQLRYPRIPTKKSMATYGESLTNFLEWCVANKLSWQEVEYSTHLIDGYQADMICGRWSETSNSLAPRTVNLRVGEACAFLEWAGGKGFRSPFDVANVAIKKNAPSGTSVHGHKKKAIEARAGAVRPDPSTLRIPTDAELAAWHKSVLIESGFTKALMCKLILETGIRREEAVQWRMDTLPAERSKWHVDGDQVLVRIKYGAKGSKTKDKFGEDVGPARNIYLPMSLALAIHEYRTTVRPGVRAKYVRSAPNEQEKRRRMREKPDRLFLSDSTGEPVSAQVLYDAWTSASKLPYKGWSPHIGRNWWACKKLISACSLRFRTTAVEQVFGNEHGALVSTAMDIIMLVIKPQLGHVSVETTQLYLAWIGRVFTLGSMYDKYAQALENVVDTFED